MGIDANSRRQKHPTGIPCTYVKRTARAWEEHDEWDGGRNGVSVRRNVVGVGGVSIRHEVIELPDRGYEMVCACARNDTGGR